MKTWIVGALVGACVGVVLYLVLSQKAAPSQESRLEPPAPPPPAPVAPVAPVVLADVVEVTGIDHLLDPPAKPLSGVPFDAAPTTVPVSTPAGPERIPPAVDEPLIEVAPFPRAVDDVSAIRDFWFGTHRLPRQVGGGLTPERLLREIDEYHLRHPAGVSPGVTVGVSLHF